ncbi:MAG TPA: hypothetical protein VEX38_01850 [Fimbriimonadaceae bacterium]|nr:hypothetical protein [Fimbriimonadaceae bacterium]
MTRNTLTLAMLSLAVAAQAQDYTFRAVATGLQRPMGIAVEKSGNAAEVYFTQNPTPGVAGAGSIARLDLRNGQVRVLHSGEPDPVNITLDQGNVYWTCRSAGVILCLDRRGQTVPVLTGLNRPVGIFADRRTLYFTQVPSPGVMGGANQVNVWSGGAIGTLSMGEPEPNDVLVDGRGNAYWTCTSAGVILHRNPRGQIQPLLTGLDRPLGIALGPGGNTLYFTEVPNPGIAGAGNRIVSYDLRKGSRRVIRSGDPEPTDVAVANDGRVFWTCTSAGVIMEARQRPKGR